jgi:hypothetical protein
LRRKHNFVTARPEDAPPLAEVFGNFAGGPAALVADISFSSVIIRRARALPTAHIMHERKILSTRLGRHGRHGREK